MIENKILFVDDEEYLLSSIERQLRNQFNIQTCSSAAEALDCIKKNNYSVIVADYHMPGMNGVEFLAKTKVIAPRTVRILFTGKADLNVAISAVNEGHVFKFLSKPYSTEKLISVLRQALGLAISYDVIVNKHKGALQVESEPGKGTTFIIRLPLDEEKKEQEA